MKPIECWVLRKPDGSLFRYHCARPPELFSSRDAADACFSRLYDPTLITTQGWKSVQVSVTIDVLEDKGASQ